MKMSSMIYYRIIVLIHFLIIVVSMEVPLAADNKNRDSDMKSPIKDEEENDNNIDPRTSEFKIADFESKLKKIESLLETLTTVTSSILQEDVDEGLDEDDENDIEYRKRSVSSRHKNSLRRLRRNVDTASLPSGSGYCGESTPSSYSPCASSQHVIYPCGQPGPQGPPGKDCRVSECQCDTGNPQNPASTGGSGTTYIRWGRSECPDTAETVYNGVIAGAWSTVEQGSGSNYICLPNSPVYGDVVSSVQTHRSAIYSVELDNPANFPPFAHIRNHEMTCAVCRVANRSTSLMIPARNMCPEEWTLEYSGYLSSDSKNNFRSEYICIDKIPEGVPGTGAPTPGGNLYVTEAICNEGGLPCGPYVNGYELTCAVCSM